ncbi:uncharacterized protein LOC129961033 [Argiope bruennichi]|uniref:uncharacterized protein LOC129961033 n=1 Tax=Argiope bruennichi TaxID=94029 RepID=UPI0024951E23|nr:uncharacterized protein LOC129961033 [Argiope bruennichi]
MINRRVFSFLKNLLIFFIDRLYREWEYIIRNGQSYSEKASERGDLYVKQLIENIIHERVGKYDPYLINRSAVISWGRTSVVLGKAEVTGLSTLHRTNICALTEVGNRLFITMNLGAGPLCYRRQITFRFGNFQRKTVALISINDIKVSIDFSIEKETCRNGFLLDFNINELNGFKLIINGSGCFSWIINLFLNFWTLALGRIIRNLLENELEKYILIRLPKYQFPVEGTSYRNGSKLIPREDAQNNETSMKENYEKSKWSGFPPIKNNLFDPYNSTKYETAKDFGFNQENPTTSKCFLQNNRISEMDNFCQLVPSLSLSSRFLPNSSCNEDLKGKAERKCDPFSLLSTEALEISRSLNRIKEKLESVSLVSNSSSQKITSHNRLTDEKDHLFSDSNISDELNNIHAIETNSNKRKDTSSSSPAKGFENELSFLMCKRQKKIGKESKMQDVSQMLHDSYRDPVKKDSKDADENIGRSKLLNEIFSEIQERSCRKKMDEKLLDMGTKFQTHNASLPAKKIESSQIDRKVPELKAEQSSTEIGTLNFDSETMKAKMDKDAKVFNEKASDERKGTAEDSNKNRVSFESCTYYRSPERNFSSWNLDLKLSNTMFQKDLLNSCSVDGKDLKACFDILRQNNEARVEDSESIRSCYLEIFSGNQGVEAGCISDPEDRIDSPTRFKTNITCDSNQLKRMKNKTNFDLKTETEREAESVSTTIQFNKKHGNDIEKIPLKCVEVHIGEELNKDPTFETDEDNTTFNSNSSEELNISPKILNEDSVHNNLLEKLADVLNEKDIECTDCLVEFSSIAGLKLNTDTNKKGLADTPHPEALHNLLQEEIIAKIHKLKSDILLESDTDDSEYSSSSPIRNTRLGI